MALATFAQADQFSLLKHIQAYESESASRPPRGAFVPYQVPYALTEEHLDNADDHARLLWFPAGIWVFGASCYFPAEVDEHATPALVWDLITENAAGTDDARKLITAATAGQAAATGAGLDAGALGAYVGERYLVFDVTVAAADPLAGTMILSLLLARGVATNALPSVTLDAVS